MTLIDFDIGLIALGLIFVFHYLGHKFHQTDFILFGLNSFISIPTGVYYITSVSFSLSWGIGIALILFAVYSAFLVFYYGLGYAKE
jgi:hypothetical protein